MDINKIKFWCQKILPTVYDESLSYYEVLAKVIVKLNEVIDNENSQSNVIETITKELNNYLSKEDGQNFVTKKEAQNFVTKESVANFKPDLLWENPRPTEEFSRRYTPLETLPENNYKAIIIMFTNGVQRAFVKNVNTYFDGGCVDYADHGDPITDIYWYVRDVFFGLSGTTGKLYVSFGDCQAYNPDSNTFYYANNSLKPIYIYGIK